MPECWVLDLPTTLTAEVLPEIEHEVALRLHFLTVGECRLRIHEAAETQTEWAFRSSLGGTRNPLCPSADRTKDVALHHPSKQGRCRPIQRPRAYDSESSID